MQCFMKKEDKSLIDEKMLNYRQKVLPSELTNTIEQLLYTYVHRNEAHFTYIYVRHTNVFEANNIYKNLPPDIISPIFCCYFYFVLGLRP